MTASSLHEALRAGAKGLYAPGAGTGLLIAHGTWTGREDFGRFIRTGDSINSPGTELAAVGWEAAIAALDAGEFPSSSGEKQMLRLAASLAGDAPSGSARPSPASTPVTSASWSGPSFTRPGNASSPDSADP